MRTLLPIDEKTAAEIQRRLEKPGARLRPRHAAVVWLRSLSPSASFEPANRVSSSNWDATWSNVLMEWMSVENLEERSAAPAR